VGSQKLHCTCSRVGAIEIPSIGTRPDKKTIPRTRPPNQDGNSKQEQRHPEVLQENTSLAGVFFALSEGFPAVLLRAQAGGTIAPAL
jgi:hypothetical protein